MGTAERKQRQRGERENLILQVARRMLIQRGYHGLTMDRIAEEIEYSKGTVYQHFSSKEDLLCAMTIEMLQDILSCLRRAAAFPGRPRERLTAMAVGGQLLFRLNPDRFQAQQVLWVSSLAERTSAPRQAALDRLHGQMIGLFRQILDEAVRSGDLVLPAGVDPRHVAHGMRSMLIGAEIMRRIPGDAIVFEGLRPDVSVRKNLQVFFDGLGWRPLSTEWDYDATVRRVLTEVFPAEYAQLKGAKQDLL